MSPNSTFSIIDALSYCYKRSSTKYHLMAFVLVNVPLVLPLCLYILVLGARQWRGGAKTSHTDFFTYNMVLVQLLCIASTCILTMNLHFQSDVVIYLGICSFLISSSAVAFFQTFTCFERYMAVIHPVTYLGLKSRSWFIIRNISCDLVWLQCIAQTVVYCSSMTLHEYILLGLIYLTIYIFFVLFCNLSVLCALIRPTPGDGAKANHSKRKAFSTITVITGTLVVKYVVDVVSITGFSFSGSLNEACTLWFVVSWFSVPSSMVLPMLYLHRNGKLPCLKTNK